MTDRTDTERAQDDHDRSENLSDDVWAEVERLKSLIYKIVGMLLILMAVGSVAIVGGLFVVTGLIGKQGDQSDALVKDRINRTVESCENTNSFRVFLSDFFETLDGDNIDIDTIKTLVEYRNLAPTEQDFVDALIAFANESGANLEQVRADYVKDYPILDCDAVRKDAKEKLTP